MQPERSVPVTLYCVVTTGVAMGFAILGLFKVPVGDQLYSVAPEADNRLCGVLQSISFDLPAFTFGNGLTVTVVDKLFENPQTVSVIITV